MSWYRRQWAGQLPLSPRLQTNAGGATTTTRSPADGALVALDAGGQQTPRCFSLSVRPGLLVLCVICATTFITVLDQLTETEAAPRCLFDMTARTGDPHAPSLFTGGELPGRLARGG